jgi:hypothetical protein
MASSCSLDRDGRAAQINRYARLATSVRGIERGPRALVVEFEPGFDRALLDELVAVERECCPFLEIEVGESRLSIAVERAEEAPMLDVFAEALSPRAATTEVT